MFCSFISRWRHKIQIFAVEIFQNVKKSATESCQILRMVTSEIIINFPHGAEHFALHPTGMHCPAWTMLLFSSLLSYYAPSLIGGGIKR